MVQSVQSGSNLGSVKKIGETQNGRAIYQISGADGAIAGMVTLPQQQCDTFEKAFDEINKSAPKLEEYMSHQSPESMKRTQKKARLALILSTMTGFLVPAATTGKFSRWIQWGSTILGGVAGFFAGSLISRKIATPPGAKEVAKASEVISKLDIQPVKV